MRVIDTYLSLASPWSFLGHAPVSAVAERHGARLAFFPVELGPIFAQTGGLPLPQRAPERQRYRLMELQRWRVKRGVDFHVQPRFWPFDAGLANCTVIAALAAGHSVNALLPRLFCGVWQCQENLAEADELTRLVDEAGLPGADLVAAARTPAILDAYDANRARALAAGVFGAPSYVLDGEVFWGQDRVELLDDALASGRAPFTGAM